MIEDAVEFFLGEAGAFVSEKREALANSIELVEVDLLNGEGFFLEGGTDDAVAGGIENGATTPEVDTVFIANTVSVNDKVGEHGGVGFVEMLDPFGRFEHV